MKTLLKWTGWMWLVAGVWAGPLPRAEVSAKAKWVLHLDAERFRESKVGQHYIENLLEQQVAAVETKIGFDFAPFLDSVTSVTVYGIDFTKGEQTTAVLLLRGDATGAKSIEEFLTTHSGKGRKAKLRQIQTEPFTIFKLEQSFAATLTNGMVVIGKTQKLVEDAWEVLAGKQLNIAATTRFAELANTNAGYVLAVAADGFTSEVPFPKNLKIFRQVEGVQLMIRESAAHLSLEIALKTGGAEVAMQIKTVTEGLLVLAKTERPDDKNLQALVNSAKISAADQTVMGTFEFSTKRAIALMKRVAQRGRRPSDGGTVSRPQLKLVLAVSIEKLVSAVIVCFGHKHFCEAVQVILIGGFSCDDLLRGVDAVLFQHHDEHLGVDDRAGVEEFHLTHGVPGA